MSTPAGIVGNRIVSSPPRRSAGARSGATRSAIAFAVAAMLLVPSPSVAADAPCASILRHAVVESLRSRFPGVSRGVLRHVACRSGNGGFEGIDTGLGSDQRQAARSALCSQELSSKSVRSIRGLLRAWIPPEAAAALQSCLQLAGRGVNVELAVSDGPETTVDVVASLRRGVRAALVPVAGGVEGSALPAGSLRITGSPEWIPGGLLESLPPTVLASALKGARPRVLVRPILASLSAPASLPESSLYLTLETAVGAMRIPFAVGAPSPLLEQALVAAIGGFPPTIDGCVDFQGVATVKRCTSIPSYQACLAELVASTLRDCRADVPPSESSLIEEEPIDPATGTDVRSSLRLVVNRSLRGSATASGSGSYEVTLPTPVRPPATDCDESCPIGPEPTCGRGCTRADAWREPVTGAAGGLWSIAALGSGCAPSTAVAGDVGTDAIDAYRAWEACERGSAWGATTSIDVLVRVGKLFQFQDPHTTHVGALWTWRNEAEVVKQATLLDVPVTVECREPSSASP